MSVIKKLFSKKAFILLPIVIGGFLLSADTTLAAPLPTFWDLIMGSAGVSGFFAALLYPIVEILARLLALAGILVNYAIQPSDITLTGSEFVIKGWTAMRDLTNMVFILILLGIALDYILFNSVGVKRSLPRLLIIAILINFSLPIAGIVLDFANVFTVFFMDNAVGGTGTAQLKFSEALANQLHLSSLFTASPDTTVTNVGKILDSTFTGTIFIILMLLGTLFVFIALAAMFFIRYFFLSILLIVLPLALVASVIPPLSSTFGKWTNRFFKWTMFAPAASFFLYLTMIFLSSNQMKVLNNATSAWTVSNTGVQITTYIFAWVLMVMSLTTAQSMGAIGASSAVTMWNKGTKWARGRAWGATKTGAAALGRRTKADEQVEKLAKGLQSVPGLGGLLSPGVRGIAVRTREAIQKQETFSTQEKAQYEKYSDGQLMAEFNTSEKSHVAGEGAKAAQFAEMLARRGKLLIRGKDGEVDVKASEALITRAYGLAKQHKNKNALNAIKRANPLVARRLITQEYGEMEKTGKAARYTDPETKEQILKNLETGKTLKEAQNDVFEMGMGDFENLKGMWSSETVQAFAESGKLTSGFVRKAADIGDEGFINSLEQYLKTLDDEKIEKLRKTNPSLVSFLRKGTAADYIEIPGSFKKNEEGGDKKEK